MEGDNISDIIDVPGFNDDLKTVIDGISALEAKIAEANDMAITVGVDLKGADNINDLTAAIQQQADAVKALTTVQTENQSMAQQMAVAVQQYGSNATAVAQQVNATGNEVNKLTTSLRQLQEQQSKADVGIDKYIQLGKQIGDVTEQIGKLGVGIKTASTATDEISDTAKAAANAFALFGESVGAGLEALGGWVTVVAGVIEIGKDLYEMFHKVSDGEQGATDKLKKYKEDLKEFQNAEANSASTIKSNILFDESKMNSQLAILKDSNKKIDERFRAYQVLHSMTGNVLDNLDLENFKTAEGTERMNKQLEAMRQYIDLQKQIDDGRKNQKTNLELLTTNEKQRGDIVSNYKKAMKNEGFPIDGISDDSIVEYARIHAHPEHHRGESIVSKLHTDLRINAEEGAQLQSSASGYDSNLKILEGRKADLEMGVDRNTTGYIKPNNLKVNDYSKRDAGLSLAKAEYENTLQLNKQKFDSSKKTAEDEKKLWDENEIAAENYANDQIRIMEKWHGKTGESEEAYNAKMKNITTERIKAENTTTEHIQAIDEKQKKLEDDKLKEQEKQLADFEKQLEKYAELSREGQEIKDNAKESHDRASGADGFLAGLGIEGGFKDSQAKKQKNIDKAQLELEDIKMKRDWEVREHGATPQLNKYDMEDIPAAQNKVDKLKADKDKEKDDAIYARKKELSQKTIELAQQTAQALKTIRDNQFAAEQQQLQAKMQQVQLQSQQQIRAIDATAGFQITKDNEKAKVAAQTTAQENALQQKQNQLALKKARADKQAAEMSILANTASAIIKIWAGYADQGAVGAVLAAAETAVVAGIGAAQYAAAASAPLPQFAKGGTTATPFFIAGEAGPEIIAPPGKTPYWSDKPTIHHEPIGTKVIPMDRMMEYAAANASGSRKYNADMQALYNNEIIMREVAKIIGEKFEDVGVEMVRATYNAGSRPIKNTVVIKDNNLQRPTAR